MWLYNISWKRPPAFGRTTDTGLYHFTAYAVSNPVLPPYSWVIEHVVLPHISVFGWVVLSLETALAVMLLTGTWVRAAALLGAGQSLAIGLCVAFAPNEWPWSYWLMVGAHLLLFAAVTEQRLTIEGVRRPGKRSGAFAFVWGVLASAVGLFASVAAGSGETRIGSSSWSVSLGSFTVAPALALLAAGLLLVGAALTGSTALAWGTVAVSVVAAVLVHVSTVSDVSWADGDASAAGLLLCVAVVGVRVAHSTNRAATVKH